MSLPIIRKFSFKSIRFTIFLLYALTLLATFCLFSSLIYYDFRREIFRKTDALLDVKGEGLESAIRTYLKTRDIEAPSGWAGFFARFQQREDGFSTIAGFLTQSDLSIPSEPLRMHVDIFDADGALIASSQTPPTVEIVDPRILKEVLRGKKRVHTLQMTAPNKKRLWVRAITKPVMENGKALYVIQVRMSLKPVAEELSRTKRKLMLTVFITLLVASWAGFFLVKVTLGPVDKMVRKIRNIRSDNLNVRLRLPDTNDEITRLANTFNEMLDRLQRAFDAQNKIIQDISHELKTPLTIHRGQLEVALKRPRRPEEYQEILQSGIDQMEKIRVIIDDLLMLARLDSSATSLEVRNIELVGLIKSVLLDMKPLAERKKIEIKFADNTPVMIPANDVHLRRLLINLLDNAIKYTPDKGLIRVEVTPQKDTVTLTIQDNGSGIDPEDLPHIFNRFYRGHRSRRGEGHGLGLSIVQSIVNAHRGRIDVESKPGIGTTFQVSFSKNSPTNLFS